MYRDTVCEIALDVNLWIYYVHFNVRLLLANIDTIRLIMELGAFFAWDPYN